MEKFLYTRWNLSVHHFPNSQTFARKHPIINLLRSNLLKASPHSGIIPFYFQQRPKRDQLYKNTHHQHPSTKHQSIPLKSNPIFHVQPHILQAPYFF